MKYIIREPFPGHVETLMTEDGRVLYTDLTLDEYLTQGAEAGENLRVVDESEVNALLEAHYDSLVSDPVPETEEEWQYALEVLPPCRWRDYHGVELFHISERLTGNLVAWHARLGDRCWTFTDRADRPFDELAEKVSRAVNNT